MRFKVVPDPRPLSFVREAARALPLVPGSEDDCCARLMADAGLDSRDAAREWITFLRAMGLVAESDGRYYRTRVDPDDAALARAFRERVHPVDDLLAVLAAAEADGETPLASREAYERVRERVPEWERSRRTDWEAVWTTRVDRALTWAETFDLAERVDGGYRPVDDPPGASDGPAGANPPGQSDEAEQRGAAERTDATEQTDRPEQTDAADRTATTDSTDGTDGADGTGETDGTDETDR